MMSSDQYASQLVCELLKIALGDKDTKSNDDGPTPETSAEDSMMMTLNLLHQNMATYSVHWKVHQRTWVIQLVIHLGARVPVGSVDGIPLGDSDKAGLATG